MQGISKLAILAASTALLAPVTAFAQETDENTYLGKISLTASSEAVDVSRTGASVTVVTEEELDTAPLPFATYLATLPGVSTNANGGLGATTSVRLRGLPAYYIGTKIDGIDVTDPAGPQLYFDFAGLTTGGLSRIEVLRGAQSALYGSEAAAGVIDISSWRPEKDGLSGQIGTEAGSNQTYVGTASVGYRDDRTELAFTLNRTITDGISAHINGTEKDGYQGTNLSAYASHDVTESLTLGASLLIRDNYTEFDASGGDADNTSDGILRGGRVFAQINTGAVEHELSFSRMTMRREVIEFATPTDFFGDRDQIGYTGAWDANDQLSINWGLERRAEDFVLLNPYGDSAGKQWTASAYAELLYAPNDQLDLSFALRQDEHSRFGGYTSGRAAVAYRPTEDWIIRAVAATGFRAPSPYELWSSYGNPAFQPEESRSFELGLERLLAEGSLKATLFDIKVDNQIIYDPNMGWGAYTQVDGEATTRGVELEASQQLSANWKLTGSYTYNDVTVEEGGSSRRGARAPRHSLAIGLDGHISDRLAANLTVTHVAGVLDESVDYSTTPYVVSQVALEDYTLANLALAYDVNDQTTAYIRVENLFDETYQTVSNFGQPGRQVYLGLQAKF
ncbi:TonB-dependent receptor [Xinfangfangia sp. CPCC 101601]|uniref:TonB-dependent receptor n=2 Tax=Pseudogemmobacter lacusdianii TaxID=3069608 RepID=A0ABU0VVL8_9RHOB|nr:TonB-dependent receptor [Xinfangfangia sp. CPCC 101601]